MRTEVADFFNDQACGYSEGYRSVVDVRSFIFSERKSVVLNMLGHEYLRILDVGCGPGVYTDDLLTRCKEFYGIDISEKMIKIARDKKLANANFSVGNIESLQFENGFFDAAVCIGVLEYLSDIERGVKEIARVLKKNGVAIFTAPNGRSLLNQLDIFIRRVLRRCNKFIKINLGRSFMNYDFEPALLDPKKMELLLNKHGFRIEETKFHIFRLSPLNRVNPRLSLYLAKKFNFITNPRFAINYVVKVRKNDPGP
jgi:ubiquinone/menaquinone biosynthesis C-methylase UbiE